MGAALLDRRAERRAGLEQMLLSDELPKRRGAHPNRERLVFRRHGRPAPGGLFGLEQPVHGVILAYAGVAGMRRWPHGTNRSYSQQMIDYGIWR